MLLFSRTVIHDVFFMSGQVFKRHIRAHAHLPADIDHDGPHQGIPGRDSSILDGEGIIRDKGGAVNGSDDAGSITGAAGSLAVESQFLCGRGVEVCAALRTGEFQSGGNFQRGCVVVTVGAAVAGESRIHEPETVQQLCACAECAADTGNARALMKSKSGRHIEYVIHIRFCGLGHPPPCVCGEGVQVAPRPFGVEDAQGEG